MTKPSRRLFILDANALLHRAWHALPPLTNPQGQVVNAVYGMMMVVMKLLEAEKPQAFVACWDTEAATFRHEAYDQYKAQREEQPDELYAQIPLIQEGLSTLGVDSLELDGYEADDLIGTIAVEAHTKGWEVVIVTGDRDALQLVRPGISVMAFKKGVTETVMYDEEEMKKQYGLTPPQFLEYKIMRGDPSDNIPGIKGIGEKGATELLQTYGDLKRIFQAAHDVSSSLSPSIRQKLLRAEAEVPALRKLVTIVTDVPITWTPAQSTRDEKRLRVFLRQMGFKTLLAKLGSVEARESGEEKHVRDVVREQKGKRAARAEEGPSFQAETRSVVQRVQNGKEAIDILERLRGAKEVVVQVARGVQGSLFGEAIEGVLLGVLEGSESQLVEIPASLIRTEVQVREACQKLFQAESVGLVAHDAKWQMRGLRMLGLDASRWSFDVMLGAYLLGAGERNHDLLSVAARFAGIELSAAAAPLRQLEAVLAAYGPVREAVREAGLEKVLERFDLPLVSVLAHMEEVGILVDRPYLAGLQKELSADRVRVEQEMTGMAGRAFNPGSPIQLAEVLFTDLKLPTKGIKKGKTGFSTAAPELEKLRGQHPIVEKIEEYREVSKLLSTYVEVLPLLADHAGRVHTTFNQAVAATGRLSSTDPNLQNIPIRTELGRRIRKAFIAPPGRVLISCDYSQIELRLAAALSKDPAMTEAFLHGEDIHRATAARIWNVALEKVTSDQRRAAKAINFGILYGQGAHGLAAVAGISYAEAKQFIQRYFEVYAQFRSYIDETKALARRLGYVETLFGRRRPLPEIVSALPAVRAQAERMAVNMPLQGTAADLMKLAMIEVEKKLGSVCGEAQMLLQVHDELVLEAPEDEAEKVAACVKGVMEQVEDVGVPIVVETKVGTSWANME